MSDRCICVGCDELVVDSLPIYLNPAQRAMLGFFCRMCIKMKCEDQHRDNQQLRNRTPDKV